MRAASARTQPRQHGADLTAGGRAGAGRPFDGGRYQSWGRAVRGGGADLLLSAVAGGTMTLMVLMGGAMIDGASTASLAVSPAPIARAAEPGQADAEIEDSDAVVATRRKAAAQEIERQWRAHETAEGN